MNINNLSGLVSEVNNERFSTLLDIERQKQNVSSTGDLKPDQLIAILTSNDELTHLFLNAVKQNPKCNADWLYEQRHFLKGLSEKLRAHVSTPENSVNRVALQSLLPFTVWPSENVMPVRYKLAKEFSDQWPNLDVLDIPEPALSLYAEFMHSQQLPSADVDSLYQLLDLAVAYADEAEKEENPTRTVKIHEALIDVCVERLLTYKKKPQAIIEKLLSRGSDHAFEVALQLISKHQLLHKLSTQNLVKLALWAQVKVADTNKLVRASLASSQLLKDRIEQFNLTCGALRDLITRRLQKTQPAITQEKCLIAGVEECKVRGVDLNLVRGAIISAFKHQPATLMGLLLEGMTDTHLDPAVRQHLVAIGLDYMTSADFAITCEKPIDPLHVRRLNEMMQAAVPAVTGILSAITTMVLTKEFYRGFVEPNWGNAQKQVFAESAIFEAVVQGLLFGSVNSFMNLFSSAAFSENDSPRFKVGGVLARLAAGDLIQTALPLSGIEVALTRALTGFLAAATLIDKDASLSSLSFTPEMSVEAKRSKLAILALQMIINRPDITETQKKDVFTKLEQVLLLKGVAEHNKADAAVWRPHLEDDEREYLSQEMSKLKKLVKTQIDVGSLIEMIHRATEGHPQEYSEAKNILDRASTLTMDVRESRKRKPRDDEDPGEPASKRGRST